MLGLKHFKITKSSEYKTLFKDANKVVSKYFTILYKVSRQIKTSEEEGGFRFGITVSKKVGNAVKRNRCKRIIRVLIRDIYAKHKCNNLIINVIARRFMIGKSFDNIKNDFIFCFNKIIHS